MKWKLVAAVFLCVPFSVVAAKKVGGMGDTPLAALDHATSQCAKMALLNNRCISQMPDPEQCSYSEKLSQWMCYGWVANEAGSCKDKGADKEWLKQFIVDYANSQKAIAQ